MPPAGQYYLAMPKIVAMEKEIDRGLIRVFVVISTLFLCVGSLNIFKSDWSEWKTRPSVECDKGDEAHQFAYVTANRVNIRDLPTVFSNVLTQKNRNDEVTVICEFGVWARINEPNTGSEIWISSGLVTLQANQPLSLRMKITFLTLFVLGAGGLIICQAKPKWIGRAMNLLLQTQDLPPHARPLISVPHK